MSSVAKPSLHMKVWRIRKGEVMVALCDSCVMGKKVSEGKLVLEVSKDFYYGDLVTAEAAVDILRVATVANLVGEEAVRCGIEAGLIQKDAVISIGGIPHAQFVQI
jgi:hypothetical protein